MIGQVIAGVMFIALVAVLSYKAWFEKEEVKRKQCCGCRKTFYETKIHKEYSNLYKFTDRTKIFVVENPTLVKTYDACPYCYSSKWIIV